MTHTTNTRNQTRPRLERPQDGRMLTGVSAGLGNHLGINPWWFRFAFIFLTMFGGAGLLLYVAAWLVIPEQGHKDPIVASWLKKLDTSDGGVIFGVVLIGAAAVVVLTQIADVSGVIVVAAILFIVGLLLYRGDILTGGGPPDDLDTDEHDLSSDPGFAPEVAADGESTSTEDPGGAVVTTAVATSLIAPPVGPPGAPPAPPKQRRTRPPKEKSMLGRFTVAVGLIVLAAMALVDLAFDSITIEPVYFLGTAVAVVGVGLLVGAWLGTARWLILIGVLLLPALWFTSFWPDNFDWTAGERDYQPSSVTAVDSPYELGMGSLTLDLRDLTPEQLAEIGRIDASVGMGELVVRTPEGVRIEFTAEVGMGEIAGPFAREAGIGLDKDVLIGDPDAPSFELHLEAGAGSVKLLADAGVVGVIELDSLHIGRNS